MVVGDLVVNEVLAAPKHLSWGKNEKRNKRSFSYFCLICAPLIAFNIVVG